MAHRHARIVSIGLLAWLTATAASAQADTGLPARFYVLGQQCKTVLAESVGTRVATTEGNWACKRTAAGRYRCTIVPARGGDPSTVDVRVIGTKRHDQSFIAELAADRHTDYILVMATEGRGYAQTITRFLLDRATGAKVCSAIYTESMTNDWEQLKDP